MLAHAKMEARTSAYRLTSISPWSGRNTVTRDPDFDQVMLMQSDYMMIANFAFNPKFTITIMKRQDCVLQ